MITHCAARESARLLLTLALRAPLQRSSQGPRENTTRGAETCDAEELLGVALPGHFDSLDLRTRY